MGIYEALSLRYDEVFPLEPERLAFALEVAPEGSRVLDLGCATGSLALALAAKGRLVTGIDLDPGMIREANRKAELARGAGGKAEFLELDMAGTGKRFGQKRFDGALCLGNTLVHLASEKDMAAFLGSVAGTLKPGSPFAVQILNYDRIIDKEIRELPKIETKSLVFERRYAELPEGGRMLFSTKITVRDTEEILSGETLLSPLRASALEKLLLGSGFEALKLYGSWGRKPFDPEESFMLVAVASRA